VCLPIDDNADIELSYDGPMVDAFVASFGIEDENIADRRRYSYINVKVLRGISNLIKDISGRDYLCLIVCVEGE